MWEQYLCALCFTTDYLLQLRYRSLSQANPSYPRTGNLWAGRIYLARATLYGPYRPVVRSIPCHCRRDPRIASPEPQHTYPDKHQCGQQRNVPDDYYLKDIHGNRFEAWPNSYRLKLDKAIRGRYQARYAYQRMLDSDMMLTACFLTMSLRRNPGRKYDIYGKPFCSTLTKMALRMTQMRLDAGLESGRIARVGDIPRFNASRHYVGARYGHL